MLINKNVLSRLGLTKLEVDIFSVLNNKPASAKDLSVVLDKPIESIHRSLQNLKNKGFLSFSDTHPKIFNAVPLRSIYTSKISELDAIFDQLIPEVADEIGSTKSGLIKYIPNRETHHKIGEDLFRNLKREVLIIASGTGEFKPSFFEAMVRINQKGIRHRVIAMSLDERNIDKLQIWKRNGIQVRHKKGKGINLVVFDREVVQIAVRVTEGSKEKEGFLIKNVSLAEFLAEFHEYIWNKSKEI
ncbi:hypothetical protein A2Z67_01535 [Candidatus Woesebacteria bacterium RBG_13_36_22]|uniref:Transcription regulator TrmB N-terminal domain-containing protein n=1 Tax=Candidatus Woesebacteria bacterium RBG_13_36_22 TaxID=1802478 RepID=A0A1F7X061_9BACT|nr:MAG: hypothetical protein A2Z67_01535 [Candidatus Woesebacteria bacterium RBG_13_36_22]